MRLYLVRHAQVAARPGRPPPEWYLSPEGRRAAEALGEEAYWSGVDAVYSSPEPKAIGTAQRIAARQALPLHIERDLREVEGRVWTDTGYGELVRRYLAGEAVHPWEPRDAALGRMRACIDSIAGRHPGRDIGAVSHGLVLAIYLADLLGRDGDRAHELWSRLRFPDVIAVDPVARRMVRPSESSG